MQYHRAAKYYHSFSHNIDEDITPLCCFMFITNKRLNTEQTNGKEHFAKRDVGFMGQEGWQINLPIIKTRGEAIFLPPSAVSCPPSLFPFFLLSPLSSNFPPCLLSFLYSLSPLHLDLFLFYFEAPLFFPGSIFLSWIPFISQVFFI